MPGHLSWLHPFSRPTLHSRKLPPFAFSLQGSSPRKGVGKGGGWDPPGTAEKPEKRSWHHRDGGRDAQSPTGMPAQVMEWLWGGRPWWGLASDGDGSCTDHFWELHGTRQGTRRFPQSTSIPENRRGFLSVHLLPLPTTREHPRSTRPSAVLHGEHSWSPSTHLHLSRGSPIC